MREALRAWREGVESFGWEECTNVARADKATGRKADTMSMQEHIKALFFSVFQSEHGANEATYIAFITLAEELQVDLLWYQIDVTDEGCFRIKSDSELYNVDSWAFSQIIDSST